MHQRIAPSVQIETAIEAVLTSGLADPDALSTLGRLGAQLVLQRAVEDEVAGFLRRTRYDGRSTLRAPATAHRPRRVQTAEGEITVAVPQVRDSLFSWSARTRPSAPLVGPILRAVPACSGHACASSSSPQPRRAYGTWSGASRRSAREALGRDRSTEGDRDAERLAAGGTDAALTLVRSAARDPEAPACGLVAHGIEQRKRLPEGIRAVLHQVCHPQQHLEVAVAREERL